MPYAEAPQTTAPMPVQPPQPQMQAPQPSQQGGFNMPTFIQNARQAGVPDSQTYQYLQQNGLVPPTNQPPQNNFLQNLVDDPLKTLLIQPAVRTFQAAQALGGDATAGTQDTNINIPLLGNVNVPAQQTGTAGVKQIAGDTLKTGAYLAPGLGEGTIAEQAGKNALAGAAFGSGQALQNNASLGDTLKQGLIGGAIGAGTSLGLNAVGKGLGALGSKITAPLGGNFDSEAANVADKYGIQLPASSVTDSSVVKNMEALASKGAFGKTLSDMVTTAGDKINNIADNLVGSAGSTDLIQGGQDILDAQKAFQKTWVQTKNQLYDTAQRIAGEQAISINPQDTIAELQQIIAQKKLASAAGPLSKDASFFQEFLDKLDRKAPPIPEPQTQTDFITNEAGTTKPAPKALPAPIEAAKPVTLQEAQATLKELNQKLATSFKSADPVITGNVGTLRKLAATLSGDIDNAMPEDIKLAAKQADAYYKQGLDKLNSSYGKKINLYKNQPDKIIPAIMNPNTSLAEIPKILDYVGPKNADNIRANVLDKIITGAKSSQGENFIQGGLTKQINKFGEDKLQAILKPEQFTAVKDLETLSKALQGGQKIASGSQTAFLSRSMAEIGAAFLHPLAALKFVAGDFVFSKFISSEAGQNILKQGFTLPENIIPKVALKIVPSQTARVSTSFSGKTPTKVRVPPRLK